RPRPASPPSRRRNTALSASQAGPQRQVELVESQGAEAAGGVRPRHQHADEGRGIFGAVGAKEFALQALTVARVAAACRACCANTRSGPRRPRRLLLL